MSEIKVATRYAKSLIDLSLEQNAMEEIKADMQFFVNTLKSSSELQAFGDKIHKTSAAFLKIVIDKGRSEIVYATAKEFLLQYYQFKKIFSAKVVSAMPLTEVQLNQLKQMVADVVKGEVILSTQVDANLIGGFVLTVGDKQFDASLATSLAKLKKTFASGVLAN
jgi:F-type H+-transporting ATPase subunit delta